MHERPILFSGAMVRALLAGWKTQTRRIIKPVQPRVDGRWPAGRDPVPDCPFGRPGDRLWVRETWALEQLDDGERVVWAADRAAAWRSSMEDCFYLESSYEPERWRSSIYMPRWASRLTLEVTGVRVERLQDISVVDAIAEGIGRLKRGTWTDYSEEMSASGWLDPRNSFQSLWTSINGTGSWAANPWVWAIEFRRVEADAGRCQSIESSKARSTP
jgi:hypothetical protein